MLVGASQMKERTNGLRWQRYIFEISRHLAPSKGVASRPRSTMLAIAKGPFLFRCAQIEAGNQSLTRTLIRNRLKDGIVGKKRVTGKIHLRHKPRGKGRTKQ